SQRTIKTLDGMGKIHYDAVAVGDDDLQFGAKWLAENSRKYSVPLVSANCFLSGNKKLFEPYILVKKGGYTFAVTAVTSPELLIEIDTSVTIKDPVKSLQSIWKELVKKSDFQIILSHLGQEKSIELADSFPDCDIIVNGHRKADLQPYQMYNNVPVMQFGFLGKKISHLDLEISGNKLRPVDGGWLTVRPDTPEDTSLLYLLKNSENLACDVYELYIMSQCPYGIEALREFTDFIQKFKNIQWDIHFIGSVNHDSTLSSLHGDEEVADEMLWLAVKELYHDQWLEFLKECSRGNTTGVAVAQKMSLDIGKIGKWVAANGAKRLQREYNRSTRMDIKGSPTLLINNIPLENRITSGRLGRSLCEKNPGSSLFCDSLPQCFDDSECRQKGKIGLCVSGKCEFRDAVKFVFTVVAEDSTLQHPEDAVISTTEELFTGAEVKKIARSSTQGQAILKKYNPKALPFYLFGNEIKQAYNFSTVEKGLVEQDDGLTFKDGVVPSNYFYKRYLHKGERVVFIDPFFSKTPLIIESIFFDSLKHNDITVFPVFYNEPSRQIDDPLEKFRIEEAGRWLLLNNYFKSKFIHYLIEYSKNPGSSYFNRICRNVGIDADSLSEIAAKETRILQNHWNLLNELNITEPVVLMINNREKIVIKSEKELFEYFSNKK
ncbi:MAG: hypothetical protein GX640_00715, partial [Fibrobacter sp.]|nr:hypothetical protein [Fibrobacter sp.]